MHAHTRTCTCIQTHIESSPLLTSSVSIFFNLPISPSTRRHLPSLNDCSLSSYTWSLKSIADNGVVSQGARLNLGSPQTCGCNFRKYRGMSDTEKERDGQCGGGGSVWGNMRVHLAAWRITGFMWALENKKKIKKVWSSDGRITVLYCVNISGLNKLWHPDWRHPGFSTHLLETNRFLFFPPSVII